LLLKKKNFRDWGQKKGTRGGEVAGRKVLSSVKIIAGGGTTKTKGDKFGVKPGWKEKRGTVGAENRGGGGSLAQAGPQVVLGHSKFRPRGGGDRKSKFHYFRSLTNSWKNFAKQVFPTVQPSVCRLFANISVF